MTTDYQPINTLFHDPLFNNNILDFLSIYDKRYINKYHYNIWKDYRKYKKYYNNVYINRNIICIYDYYSKPLL